VVALSLPRAGFRRALALTALGVTGGALIAGYAHSASPGAAVVAVAAVAAILAIVRYPEWGALTVVCLAIVVPRETLFGQGITLGPGSLKITDALVLLTLGAWLAHRAIDPGARRLPGALVTALTLGVVGVGVMGVVVGRLNGIQLQQSLNEFRPLMAYLLVFPLVAFIKDLRALRRALVAVLAACAAGSIWIIWLYVQGEGSAATFTTGAIRVTEVTFLPAMLGSIWALVLLPHCRTTARQVAAALLAVLSLTGLFFTLQRGAWIAFIIGSVLAAALMTPARRVRLAAAGFVVVGGMAAAVLAFNAVSSAGVGNPLEGGLQRLQSVNSYGADVSALHRKVETETALAEFREHPIAGIGLGGKVAFFSPLFNPGSGSFGIYYENTYVHNSYLFMLLKTGVVGLVALLLLLAHTLARGLALARSHQAPELRLGALGSCATLAALMAVSFSGPHLTNDSSTPYIACVIAGLEVLRRLSRLGSESRPDVSHQ
jgi:O-antigen ligase